jgi:hypothetical protein
MLVWHLKAQARRTPSGQWPRGRSFCPSRDRPVHRDGLQPTHWAVCQKDRCGHATRL